ncbi:MAG: protein kinase [Planctomycetota bacterium]
MPLGRSKEHIVVQHLDGESLADTTGLTPEEIIRVGMDICAALAHTHARGLIHQDIKPANIKFAGLDRDTRKATLIDFGLSVRREHAGNYESLDTRTTGGTRGFMAPEQLQNHPVSSPATDIYSLGVTLAFCASEGTAKREKRLRETVLRSRKLPRKLRKVLLKATEPEPAMRHASAAEFWKALSECIEPTEFGFWLPIGRGRKRYVLVSEVLIVVVLAYFVLSFSVNYIAQRFRASPAQLDKDALTEKSIDAFRKAAEKHWVVQAAFNAELKPLVHSMHESLASIAKDIRHEMDDRFSTDAAVELSKTDRYAARLLILYADAQRVHGEIRGEFRNKFVQQTHTTYFSPSFVSTESFIALFRKYLDDPESHRNYLAEFLDKAAPMHRSSRYFF